MAVKPVDFKFLAIFRLLLGAMLVLTFFMQWTKDIYVSGLDAWPGYVPPMKLCSGWNYFLGCYPTFIDDLYIRTWYLILTPVIACAGVLVGLKQKKEYQLFSAGILMLSAVPMIIWYLDMDNAIPDYYSISMLSYGFQSFFALLFLNLLLILFALKYTDLD